MPGCVLRATGDAFQVDSFLEESSFEPWAVYRKGERRSENRVWHTSGMNILVSDASGEDLMLQVRDAVAFLEKNKEKLSRLRSCVGVEAVELDFGINRKNVFVQCSFFPPELTKIAGEFGMGFVVRKCLWCSTG